VLPIPATFEQPTLNSGKAAAAVAAAGAGGPVAVSARVVPAAPVVPLAAGFAVAIPLTWGQRLLRGRIRRLLARQRISARR
jgi:hypothetical protein